MPEKVFCTDCGAEAQRTGAGLRCPWAVTSTQRTAWVGRELLLSCGAPYERQRSLVLPSQTRSR